MMAIWHIAITLFITIAVSNAVSLQSFRQQQHIFQSQNGPAESPKRLRYAALGDSWASGVNWGPPSNETEYDFPDDAEVCRCRRMREAYPAQLVEDDDFPVDLDFVACHGSWFDDVGDQVARLNQSSGAFDFATLMIGGNPAGFPAIVDDCIFQFDYYKDYGAEFPDPTGACSQTLALAHAKIHSPWFLQGVVNSIYNILYEPRIRANPNFRLYVLSYTELFNHDDEKCNEWSFGYWPGKKPRLSTALRRAINSVIDDGRVVYDNLINRSLWDPKVRYIDINDVFANHRFCEPTESGTFEAQVNNSWLYTIAKFDCVPLADESETPLNVSAKVWPTICRKCGGYNSLGEFQRVFHPTREGHSAVKKALKGVLQREIGRIK